MKVARELAWTRPLIVGLVFLFLSQVQAKDMSNSDRLRAVIAEYTQGVKRLDAFSADYFEVEEDLGKFGDYMSPQFFERSKNLIRKGLTDLASVDVKQLKEADRVEYQLFKGDLETSLHQFDFPSELLAFNQMDNRLVSYIDQSNPALSSFPFDSVKHYQAFIKRSEGFPAYVNWQIAMLRRGIKENITLNCGLIEKTVRSYSDGLEPVPEKNPFFRPTLSFPKTFSQAEKARLTKGFRKMIAERIVPGFRKLDTFFQKEYAPHCRSGFGLSSLPNGKAWYAYEIHANTDTDLSAAEIHELGLKEVARIEGEMTDVQKQLGISGTRQEFLSSLMKDPRYFFTSEKDLVRSFEQVRSSVEAKLPQYFSYVPKTDFQFVKADNPEDAAGMYHDPTEMKPVGRFVYNAAQLRAIPKYEVTTLLMHETVPGHHLQLALAFEMRDHLSEYRRKIFSSTAFVEGWALYSEYLGREMGMYRDPVQRLGNLNDELLRAVRLVVDTGIHAMGWNHDQTVAYMKQHLASDDSEIEVEANRYSVWPAQALAYKIGQLKIIELRQRAEKELGDKFDIKAFHRAVIGSGTVSLHVLTAQVDQWIDSVKASTRAPTAL